jgi:hypothetical protein
MSKRINCTKKWQMMTGLILVAGFVGNAQAALFIYQMPGGTRIITDHALVGKEYKLVRKSESARGVGGLVSERSMQSATIDPTSYDRLIKRTAAAHHVDVALVKAVMHAESGFNPNALSPKGASGLMQLMPATAERYGVEDIFDPVQNVQGGVRYLKDLMVMFKDNHRLVVAAYNAGENAVRRHKGIPPYAETRDYVVKVMRYQKQYTPKVTNSSKPSMAQPAVAKPTVVGEMTPAPLAADTLAAMPEARGVVLASASPPPSM